jgi:hypothetical protein
MVTMQHNTGGTKMVSFITDIAPLMTDGAPCMDAQGWLLTDLAFMTDPAGGGGFTDHYHARRTYFRLTHPNPNRRMPPGGPFWPEEQLALYRQWMDGGFNP